MSWYDDIGTTHEKSPHREAPNKHERGGKKYKEMISRDSKRLDDHANLPFSFSKPAKKTRAIRDCYFTCSHCGNISAVNKHTCGIACRCGKYSSLTAENTHRPSDKVQKEE
jgi:hypothetical protein